MPVGRGQLEAGLVAEHAAGRTRTGLAAEVATRISPRWAAWARAEAGYESGAGGYARGLLGMRGRW